MTTATLDVRGLTKRFGGVEALLDVSFSVSTAEVVALIGPNGAGKTTCFNVLGGQLRADAGSVHLLGHRIDGLAPHEIAHRGVARTFQVAATFASMTVRDNVALALLAHRHHDASVRWSLLGGAQQEADALLEQAAMSAIADLHTATLPYGETKRLELALALATQPRLLLMDEPTAGMAPDSRAALMRLALDAARQRDIAVLFTEHDMDVVFGFAHRVIVMDRGQVIAMGTPEQVRADARVQEVYLGTGEGTSLV